MEKIILRKSRSLLDLLLNNEQVLEITEEGLCLLMWSSSGRTSSSHDFNMRRVLFRDIEHVDFFQNKSGKIKAITVERAEGGFWDGSVTLSHFEDMQQIYEIIVANVDTKRIAKKSFWISVVSIPILLFRAVAYVLILIGLIGAAYMIILKLFPTVYF